METGKEKRVVEKPNRDPRSGVETFEYGNQLTLPDGLKKILKDKGLDFRFLNASQFRSSGNYHRSQWKPYTIDTDGDRVTYGATAEGVIQRGDLILGVRPKAVTAKHREFLKERNRRYSNFNKMEAQKLRQHVRDTGLSNHVKVDEGYGDDED